MAQPSSAGELNAVRLETLEQWMEENTFNPPLTNAENAPFIFLGGPQRPTASLGFTTSCSNLQRPRLPMEGDGRIPRGERAAGTPTACRLKLKSRSVGFDEQRSH